MKMNPLTATDFYKTGHRKQYPAGSEYVYSNFTARSCRLTNLIKENFDDKIVFFGLQGFIKTLKETWDENFFNQPMEKVVAQYKRRMDNSLGVGAVPVDHIEALHKLGYLPIKIKALPEGSRVNIGVPVLTIINTVPEFFWFTNYLESLMSAELWRPCTSATTAYEYKKLLTQYAVETGGSLDFVPFQGHDFSFRGMGGYFDAITSGAGHLLSFVGTDTIPAIDYLEEFYGADSDKELVGCSVPATEHSVMCMGTMEDEVATFDRLISEVCPKGIVSIVSDTWDFWEVITKYTIILKDVIMQREGKVVFRPDSGDPVRILTGLKYYDFDANPDKVGPSPWAGYEAVKRNGKFYEVMSDDSLVEIPEHVVKGAVECLWDIFGGNTNKKGYRTLDQHVGLIYGDAINLQRADKILKRLKAKGFASDNVVFGIGSFTYVFVTRDTYGFAMKATWGQVNGEARELFKNPKTDTGFKKSAKGLLRVEKEGDDYVLYDQQTKEQEEQGELKVVFEDGNLVVETTLSEMRDRLRIIPGE
jgi:nicotinamide phosphoribosyltransferase